MAEHQSESATFSTKHHFVIRRLHSLTGLVPVGVFLCFHLMANATILVPGEAGAEFDRSIAAIHLLGPFLIPVEIVFIFVPILFHAVLGLQIYFTGRSNAQQYRYGGNIRYTLQRATGVIALLFIFYHVWQLHWFGTPIGGGSFDLQAAASSTAAAIQGGWWVAPIYALGVVACVFHLANGIWTSLITWGITIRPPSQRAAGYVCAVFGVVLSLVGLGALRAFKIFTPEDTKTATEQHAAGADHVP